MKDKILKECIDETRVQINISNERYCDDSVKGIIEKIVLEHTRDFGVSYKEKKEIIDMVFNATRKDLDILQPYAEDDEITEIMVNGPDCIFIEKNGKIQKAKERFTDIEHLESVIRRIAAKVHREINDLNPIVDARLDDGSRINAVYKNIAINGPILTIRKFPVKSITMEDLIDFGTITPMAANMLRRMVEAKYNIFISGGTSSGKTTFLNVLSNYIPREERIITIEDSAELKIENVNNIVIMETKNANVQGKGEVTIRDLIKTSLRMRPDRIIIGEVRGKEALDMLQAMNTGHEGSISTGHANSPKGMLSRLESMVLTAADLPLKAIRQQIVSAIDIIVHLGRLNDKSRRVLEISEVAYYREGEIVLNPLFKFERALGANGQLEPTENPLKKIEKMNMAAVKSERGILYE